MAVYFIRAGEDGPVKIGWADDANQRLTELQCGNHAELRIIRAIDGAPRAVERKLHAHFADIWIRGEWFHYSDEMLTIEPPQIAARAPSPISAAIDHCGGQAELARRIGVTQAAVWHWLHRAKRIPATKVLKIQAATDNAVRCWQMRPDLWPPHEYAPKAA